MSILEVTLNQFSRLLLCGRTSVCQSCTRGFRTQGSPLAFKATQMLSAEPPKKKKRIDSHLVMVKEIKRKNRLEKQIKRLEVKERIPKPVAEIHGERYFRKTLEDRERERSTLSFEETERRAILMKKWCRYKAEQHAAESRMIQKAIEARENALQELRQVSEELYLEALKIDPKLTQFTANGPVQTPPLPNYVPPDGEIKNTTRMFSMEQPHSAFPVVDSKTNKFS